MSSTRTRWPRTARPANAAGRPRRLAALSSKRRWRCNSLPQRRLLCDMGAPPSQSRCGRYALCCLGLRPDLPCRRARADRRGAVGLARSISATGARWPDAAWCPVGQELSIGSCDGGHIEDLQRGLSREALDRLRGRSMPCGVASNGRSMPCTSRLQVGDARRLPHFSEDCARRRCPSRPGWSSDTHLAG